MNTTRAFEKQVIEYAPHYVKIHKKISSGDWSNGMEYDDAFGVPGETATVIFSDKYTIVILSDGSKGVAKCMPGQQFVPRTGFQIAMRRAQIEKMKKEIEELSK